MSLTLIHKSCVVKEVLTDYIPQTIQNRRSRLKVTLKANMLEDLTLDYGPCLFYRSVAKEKQLTFLSTSLNTSLCKMFGVYFSIFLISTVSRSQQVFGSHTVGSIAKTVLKF